ncbi:MAG: hypothetical protein CGW95_01545 [Phenylobacterium zucineum]|nr:MAG: hypothetical protein CGW95_01545 [Phenylobacterium zucineum]
MNAGHRDALKALADKLIAQTADRAELDTTYAKAAKAVSDHMKRRYPPADMAVLEKYGQAHVDRCVYVSTGGSNYQRFEFRADDALAALRPGSRNSCNHRTPLLLTDDEDTALTAYNKASRAREAEIKQRRDDFYTLINSALTYEELVAVWPAADALREQILGTSRAIAVMSAEVVARIRADAAAVVEVVA